MKAIEIQSAEFGQVRSRKDYSVACSFVTPELRQSEAAVLLSLHGRAVRILIEPHDVEPEETVVVDTDLETKTPGQRLRGIIFVHYEQQGRHPRRQPRQRPLVDGDQPARPSGSNQRSPAMMTFNDWSALVDFLLLFGTACASLGYLLGNSHGHEAGRLTGENETRHDLIPRVMNAKRDGVRAGRILGMRETICLIFPVFQQEERPMQPRPRKPGTHTSAAPATQGATLSKTTNEGRSL